MIPETIELHIFISKYVDLDILYISHLTRYDLNIIVLDFFQSYNLFCLRSSQTKEMKFPLILKE